MKIGPLGFLRKGNITTAVMKTRPAITLGQYKTWDYLFTGFTIGRWGFGVLYQKTEKVK